MMGRGWGQHLLVIFKVLKNDKELKFTITHNGPKDLKKLYYFLAALTLIIVLLLLAGCTFAFLMVRRCKKRGSATKLPDQSMNLSNFPNQNQVEAVFDDMKAVPESDKKMKT